MTMDPQTKGLFGYIQDVREEYPPVLFEDLQGATQTSIQEDRVVTKGNHNCVPSCEGCSAKRAELRFHLCNTWCRECKRAQAVDARARWKMGTAMYEFTEIIVAVSVGRTKPAEMSILHIRPYE